MWYIWKARNDHHFNRRTWSPSQVNQASSAHMCNYASALSDSITPHTDTNKHQTNRLSQEHDPPHPQQPPGMQSSIAGSISTPHEDNLLVTSPSSLQGPLCYIDAATHQDSSVATPKDEGICLFIVHSEAQPPLNIYIKACIKDSTSVVMTEAAAMALAIQIISIMRLDNTTVLSDSLHFV